MRSLMVSLLALLLFASIAPLAQAQTDDVWRQAFAPRADHDPWRVDWQTTHIAWQATGQNQTQAQPPLHAAAIEHSDAFRTRAKIHKYASFATLPLFATELALGQSLYNSSANADSKRGIHAALGIGIVSLFGVNTVTGAWNMWGEEGRQEKDGRTLRLVHGLLMMAANAGFVATAMTGPNSNSQREALTYESDKVLHRNLAIASIGIGTVGYVIMLFGNH